MSETTVRSTHAKVGTPFDIVLSLDLRVIGKSKVIACLNMFNLYLCSWLIIILSMATEGRSALCYIMFWVTTLEVAYTYTRGLATAWVYFFGKVVR